MTCQITLNPTVKFLIRPPFKVFIDSVARANLNKDFELINNWDFRWKMHFNQERNKQA